MSFSFLFFFYGSCLETLHDSDWSIRTAEVAWKLPHKYNPKALFPLLLTLKSLSSATAWMKIAVTIFPRPAFICCCSLCGAAVPVVSTEITTSPRRQMKGKHTEITKGGKPLRPTLWSSLIPSSTWLLHAAQACAGHGSEREDDRQAYTQDTRTSIQIRFLKERGRFHCWPWDKIISTHPPLRPDYISSAR